LSCYILAYGDGHLKPKIVCLLLEGRQKPARIILHDIVPRLYTTGIGEDATITNDMPSFPGTLIYTLWRRTIQSRPGKVGREGLAAVRVAYARTLPFDVDQCQKEVMGRLV
jgi:hypothetical protein